MVGTIRILKQFMPCADLITTIQCGEYLSRTFGLRVVRNKVFSFKSYSLYYSMKSSLDLIRCVIYRVMKHHLSLNLRWLIENRKLKEWANADVIIHLGGDVLSDYLGQTNLLEHLKDLLLGVVLEKPVVIWGESVGPIRSRFCRFLAKFVLNKVAMITLREEASKVYLCNIGIHKPPIYVTADPAFLCQAAPKVRVKEILDMEGLDDMAGPLIGITPSVLSLLRRMSNFSACMFSLYSTFQYFLPEELFRLIVGKVKRLPIFQREKVELNNMLKVLAEVADGCIENLNANVVLIPHVQAGGPYANDKELAMKVVHLMKHGNRAQVIRHNYTAEEIGGIIGCLHLLIGSRMHANIAALSQCIPVIALPYHGKFHNVMVMVGQERYVCDEVTTEAIMAKLSEVWNRRQAIREQLEYRVRNMKELALSQGKLVREMLYNISNC